MSHIARYGNVVLLRSFCSKCKSFALIRDGEYQCCDRPCREAITHEARMSQPNYSRKKPTVKIQKKILAAQQRRCLYCNRHFDLWYPGRKNKRLQPLKLVWDHIIAYARDANNYPENFAAACSDCNGHKSSKIFNSIQEIKNAIYKKSWPRYLPDLPEKLRADPALADLLRENLPAECLGRKQPAITSRNGTAIERRATETRNDSSHNKAA